MWCDQLSIIQVTHVASEKGIFEACGLVWDVSKGRCIHHHLVGIGEELHAHTDVVQGISSSFSVISDHEESIFHLHHVVAHHDTFLALGAAQDSFQSSLVDSGQEPIEVVRIELYSVTSWVALTRIVCIWRLSLRVRRCVGHCCVTISLDIDDVERIAHSPECLLRVLNKESHLLHEQDMEALQERDSSSEVNLGAFAALEELCQIVNDRQ